jgi:type IV secretory pathway TraG/TraD family ATPase VirD4
MRRARNRLSQSAMAEEIYAVFAVAAVIALVALIWTAVHLGAAIDHLAAPANNPVMLVLDLLRKKTPWSSVATIVVAAELVSASALAFTIVWVIAQHRGRRELVDVLARRLPRNAKALRRYSNPEDAPVASGVGPGLALGHDVVSGAVIRQSWEDVAAIIAGARTGKTTTQVAPAILAAPGAVYTCSNKRDVVDLTAGPRTKVGSKVWIFDPQGIAETQPTWWWNPLDMATNLADARNLAGLFAAASRPPGAQRDAYFDPEGEELLAILLLAARLSDEPLTTVYEWLSTGRNDRVVSRLAAGGHELAASALLDVMNQPDKQRAGVFGTARKDVSFLADSNLGDWITDRGDNRARFDTDAFARSTDTLYSLSKEGPGSAGPLTAALTAAVVLSAERLAARSVGGRLEVPMVCPLDEVANVCRWRELPDLYSHYGSRGIILMSFLQSWSQGVDVWGEQGMRKLWGAANIRLYGGGSNEQGFLHDISSVCGEMDARQLTTSYNGGRGGRSRSYATRREPIFDVATLAALPRGRAVLMASGIDPVVIRTQSVLDGPHGTAVRDSLAKAAVTVAHSERHLPLAETRQSHELEREPMNDDD